MLDRIDPSIILKKLVQLAPLKLSASFEYCSTKCCQYASIACIVRIKRYGCQDYNDSTLNIIEKLKSYELEILYIKRTSRKEDQWSGHIAFPGGHIDPGETDYSAVIREVQEEVGIDVGNSDQFIWLGRLSTRSLRKAKKKTIKIIPHIFLYIGHSDEILITPNPSEVSVAWWVNMRNLMKPSGCGQSSSSSSPMDKIVFDVRPYLHRVFGHGGRGMDISVTVLATLGLTSVRCPCIHLPRPPSPLSIAMPHEEEDCNGPNSYALWGMTLFVTQELLRIGNDGIDLIHIPHVFEVDNLYITRYLNFIYRGCRGCNRLVTVVVFILCFVMP
eukprot:gene37030-48343_t